MKLESFFNDLQNQKLSDAQRNTTYEHILLKTQYNKPFFLRKNFYFKFASYVLVLGLVGMSLYIPFLSQNSPSTNTAGKVNAGLIAKVVTIKGQYYITSAGQRIDGANISDGDSVVLAKDSSLVVHVGDHVEGKITGPATFSIHRQDAGYVVTLQQGDYVEMSTLGTAQESPQVSVVSVNHKFTARTNAGKEFHFYLTQRDQESLVINKAGDALTLMNSDNPNSSISLAEDNKATLNGSTILTAFASASEVARLLQQSDLNSIDQRNTNTDYNNGFFRTLLLAQETNDQTSVTTTADESQAIQSDSNKDAQNIRVNLLPQFVWVDVKYLTYYYMNGQEHEYQISYENLLKRIYNLYDAAHVNIPSDGILATQKDAYSLSKLSKLASYLNNNLPEKLPAYQKKTMKTIVVFLEKLQQQTYGSYKGTNLTVEEMFANMH